MWNQAVTQTGRLSGKVEWKIAAQLLCDVIAVPYVYVIGALCWLADYLGDCAVLW